MTNWENILLSVEKPSRYIGAEVNAVKKDRAACKMSFALAFPDTYEVGMSHQGMQILYAILNDIPDMAAERCYAPWPDMERRLREFQIPLASLESHTPLHRFDVVGFSLQYELSYTNVLNMLELGGVPIHSVERKEGHPIIIAGGPCCFNPAPMSPFMDAFVIGEGEDVIKEIVQCVKEEKDGGKNRHAIINALAGTEGVYVPQIHTHGETIIKRVVPDLNRAPFPIKPVVPLMKTIHDRVSLEIARGCSRGCRFCQAGMVWRPVRERHLNVLKNMADCMLKATGCDELSLLSLSSGDYSLIEPLLVELSNRYAEQKVALALPSMRVETLTAGLIEEIRKVRKTSFTLAPEAGTQRLRNIINKGNTEADLLATTNRVFEAGWRAVKLYFMIGLPGETDEDLEGIADLAHKCLHEGKNRGQVTVSLSTFVPKPHTPFQWQRQIGLDETLDKQAFFKKRLRHRMLNVKWHDGRMSLLEGIFSRGDDRLSALIEKAYRLGCRFDGWSDRFRFDLWEQAIAETGINTEECLRGRSFSDALPWDKIDCGVRKEFLIEEAEKSLSGELTEDCRLSACSDCGVCDDKNIGIITADEEPRPLEAKKAKAAPEKASVPAIEKRLRLTFVKQDEARFLSHLEISTALIRAINKSGLSFVYSQGFHPHPKISFATATPVGMESMGEFAEIQAINPPGDDHGMMALIKKINESLPAGIKIAGMEPIPAYAASLFDIVKGFEYRIVIPDQISVDAMSGLEDKIAGFLNTEEYKITKETKSKTVVKNIRPLVQAMDYDRQNRTITIAATLGKGGAAVRPVDILTEVLGVDGEAAKTISIIKTKTFLSHP
ncbi:MAG: TIGR03960 family B12-binding radical SAM protein [Deltaproteobacteria bacterium]|nr:TIGR03960 family B12-binding radical SAM protein [Deltaproteobacteria bacterium]